LKLALDKTIKNLLDPKEFNNKNTILAKNLENLKLKLHVFIDITNYDKIL